MNLDELKNKFSEIKLLKNQPKDSDKKIINDLLSTLDINQFQNEIVEQNCWYGYRKDSIKKISEFCEKTKLLNNKTADETLNNLLIDLSDSLEKFNYLASKVLYSDTEDYYTFNKGNPIEYDKAKNECPKVNEQSERSFKILKEMIDYLKTKNYFEK